MAETSTPPDTDCAFSLLTPKDAIKLYAADLEKNSWCIDVSSHPVKALHADTNHNKVPEDFRYDFPAWASRNRVRVETDDYAKFLNSLVPNLTVKLPRIVGSAMRPVPEKFFNRNGAKFANTFVPFAPDVPSVFEMPEILEEYQSRVFMNDQDRKHVTQWMADIVQNPMRRPQWAVVVTGEQGTGKSSIHRIVKAALGGRHVWDGSEYQPVFKQFSELLPDNLLVAFDDVPASKKDHYETLKQAITRESQWVELKNVQKQVLRDVYARILICSNRQRPLKVEAGDRRLYVAERSRHKHSPEETAEFFVRFNKWLAKPSTPAILYQWLHSIDLSDFTPGSTIKTEAHAKMVELSESVLEALLKEYVAGKPQPIFHDRSLLDYLAENGVRNPAPDLIKLKMADLSYEHKHRGRKVPGCGDKQIPLWQPISKRARALTADEEDAIRRIVAPDFQNP